MPYKRRWSGATTWPIATLLPACFLAVQLDRPLFLEGETGVGKTEIAKVLSTILDADLIRLQCYEGLDVSTAVYEWNYARQILQDPYAGGGRRG